VIVLTGATGFVGGELLTRLLDEGRDVVALVRARDDAAAQARLDETLALLLAPGAAPAGSVRAVAADLEQPGLGLSPARRAAIARDAESVVHCAASVQFTLPADEARRINVDGTRAMLDLAAGARALDRFVHVSTAYVAGDRTGRCHEHEGYVGQAPRNTYESTKLEAERQVRSSGLGSPAILRPSVVVGDSRTGWTPAFNVIYWPLQAFARGLFPVVPGDPGARIDIVPVDTVADALLELVRGRRRTGAVHVVAGDDAPTAQQLATMASEAFAAPVPRFVAPGAAPEIEERAGPFLPYFRFRGVFDARRGRELGFVPPRLDDYFDVLLRYARLARWGKRPRARWDAAEPAAA
jgi:nucleoside-diphosphate-sugar epimerase